MIKQSVPTTQQLKPNRREITINVLVESAFRTKEDALFSNPAIFEVPGTGIRFLSGTPQSVDDALRINSALGSHIHVIQPKERNGDPNEPL